eukprot:309107-Hanusia_phi.AAC.1
MAQRQAAAAAGPAAGAIRSRSVTPTTAPQKIPPVIRSQMIFVYCNNNIRAQSTKTIDCFNF